MNILQVILRLASAAISLYTLLCFIRILLTWIPNMGYNKFTLFLGKICDPYLNLFRGLKWLVWGSLDFSPAVALCILGACSTILGNFANAGKVSVGVLLAMVVSLAWSIVSSLLVFLVIVMIIRLIMLAVNKNSYSGGALVEAFDRAVSSVVFKISATFYRNKSISYKKALICSGITLFAIELGGSLVINVLTNLLTSLPF